ncbi:hypothetical protein QR680_011205 [Steinernema hermaphroditum]|uniref:Uncharacterized protein n=1 Tax=Steinernema hermaphroditum TaxID=289476 RepID=A0AA39ISV5_9BILA|nr:hypothetical protein QR680_011205 [Steinernema hermaphroditum]
MSLSSSYLLLVFALIVWTSSQFADLPCRPNDDHLRMHLAFRSGYDPSFMAVTADEAARNFITENPSFKSDCGPLCLRLKRDIQSALNRTAGLRADSFEEALNQTITIDLPQTPELRYDSDLEYDDLCKSIGRIDVRSPQFFPRIRLNTACKRGGNADDKCIFFSSRVRNLCSAILPYSDKEYGDDYAEGRCITDTTKGTYLFKRSADPSKCDDWVTRSYISPNGCACKLKKSRMFVKNLPNENESTPCGPWMRNFVYSLGETRSLDVDKYRVDYVCYPQP